MSGVIWLSHSSGSQALSSYIEIKSGINGYCLNDTNNQTTPGGQTDIYACNKSAAENWNMQGTVISHDNNLCLGVTGNSINLSTCNSTSPSQVWLSDGNKLLNPGSGKCLKASSANNGASVIAASCPQSNNNQTSWTGISSSGKNISLPGNCSGDEGQMVACYAEKEWANWQSGVEPHEALLTSYTDGAPYEEWCADFVSYVYKEAGYPFTGGETNGWDENVAGNIQNQGFTVHQADGSYVPKPGDVGYFSYNGGHVEIVITGGKHPTFIYGNSHVTDPTTGNGEMTSNTMLSDGSAGRLLYYLSPNIGS